MIDIELIEIPKIKTIKLNVEYNILKEKKLNVLFEVIEEAVFIYKLNGNIKNFKIPKGFQTDSASIPRLFWLKIAPEDEPFFTAGIIHDVKYRKISQSENISRIEADAVFKALIKKGYKDIQRYKTSVIMSNISYYSLRIIAGKYFKVIDILNLI